MPYGSDIYSILIFKKIPLFHHSSFLKPFIVLHLSISTVLLCHLICPSFMSFLHCIGVFMSSCHRVIVSLVCFGVCHCVVSVFVSSEHKCFVILLSCVIVVGCCVVTVFACCLHLCHHVINVIVSLNRQYVCHHVIGMFVLLSHCLTSVIMSSVCLSN